MKKVILVLFLTLSCLCLFGCRNSEMKGPFDLIKGFFEMKSKGYYTLTDEEHVEKTLRTLIENIENNERDAIKKMFSQEVITSVDEAELDKGIDYLFEIVKGAFNCDYDKINAGCSRKSDYGKVVEIVRSGVDVKIEEDEYLVYLAIKTMDTENPQNEGVLQIQLIHSDFKNSEMAWKGTTEELGIYYPN